MKLKADILKDGGKRVAKVRRKETAAGSFFGNFLYDQKVAEEHFLRRLKEVIEWERFTGHFLVH